MQRPYSKVQLEFEGDQLGGRFSGDNLISFVIVFVEDYEKKSWKEAARTEKQKGLHPKWTKKILVNFYLTCTQRIKIVVFQNDGKSQQDYIGEKKIKIVQLICSQTKERVFELQNAKDPQNQRGSIKVKAEEIQENLLLKMEWNGSKLDKRGVFGKANPYLFFSRCTNPTTNEFLKVAQTEVVQKNINPKWNKIEISSFSLCQNDYQNPIKIECWDLVSKSDKKQIGSFTTTLDEIQNQKRREFALINPRLQKKKKKYKNSGIIQLKSIETQRQSSIVDFLSDKFDFRLVIGIDFTISNGKPNFPESLHFITSEVHNPYEKIIKSVGGSVTQISPNQGIPVFGFGAKININKELRLSHCFPVNGNIQNPECNGIEEVLRSYKNALGHISLAGPTNVSLIIQVACKIMMQEPKNTNYYVVLIMIDGDITDFEETKEALLDASYWPIMVVFVGIGDNEFTQMDYFNHLKEDPIIIGEKKLQFDNAVFIRYLDYQTQHPNIFTMKALEKITDHFIPSFQSRDKIPKTKN
ncbi:copine [Anaeramoeba ignava]|uniref:Copine n=1 Tax=Anaeramoeba ignava TaxID=1746090 RepID=A0A9Q0L8V4_ANAIG|nr:copine [Anaeramoeba ignava]